MKGTVRIASQDGTILADAEFVGWPLVSAIDNAKDAALRELDNLYTDWDRVVITINRRNSQSC